MTIENSPGPSQGQGSPYAGDPIPLPDDPELALAHVRRLAAAEIERLINLLDLIGGDPDLEDGDADDPTRFEGRNNEAANAFLKPDDSEPSLGWTHTVNQTARQYHGNVDDLEDEHDGREEGHDAEDDRADSEPSLGWTIGGALCAANNGDDSEHDPGHREPTKAQRERWRRRADSNWFNGTVGIGPDGPRYRVADLKRVY